MYCSCEGEAMKLKKSCRRASVVGRRRWSVMELPGRRARHRFKTWRWCQIGLVQENLARGELVRAHRLASRGLAVGWQLPGRRLVNGGKHLKMTFHPRLFQLPTNSSIPNLSSNLLLDDFFWYPNNPQTSIALHSHNHGYPGSLNTPQVPHGTLFHAHSGWPYAAQPFAMPAEALPSLPQPVAAPPKPDAAPAV